MTLRAVAHCSRSLLSFRRLKLIPLKKEPTGLRCRHSLVEYRSMITRVCAASGEPDAPSNRLGKESSPYLLQHASNPVNWYPWGEEAFSKARSEQKPIFLSIGYSTCHWCHVMERESFEDADTAELINKHFIAVKVDREDRPDVDRVYMSYIQAVNGHGGWPMTVFLTPELKPFFGGTYFPKEDSYGMPAFSKLLNSIANIWTEQRQQVIDQSESTMEQLTKFLIKNEVSAVETASDEEIDRFVDGCSDKLISTFDRVHGGFGNAPKFPRPSELHLLLTDALRLKVDACSQLFIQLCRTSQDKDATKAEELIEMVTWTLKKMSNGGIYDHVGGGFHRYSVDELWHVPHFEKMLYDNPQIAIIYLHTCQWTGEAEWGQTACGVLDYLKRDMTDPQGGIYSAEDADSFDRNKDKKAEGAFYVWTEQELEEILTEEAFNAFAFYYSVRSDGNCNMSERSDPHREFIGKNCLFVSKELDQTADALILTIPELCQSLDSSRQKVYLARKQRPKPHLDNKIVTAWNGMTISAFAQASSILSHISLPQGFPAEGHAAATYLDDAKKVSRFVLEHLWDGDRMVLNRSICDGQISVEGYADDYAWMISGLLDLYEHSGELQWLQWAVQLQERMDDIFYDAVSGGYFSTSGNDPSILLRLKEEYDSAEPSASSVAVANLVRLSAILSSRSGEWLARAKLTIQYFAARLKDMPQAMPQLAYAMCLYKSRETMRKVVICTSGGGESEKLLKAFHKNYNPLKALMFVDLDDSEGLRFWKQNSRENLRVLGKVVDWGDEEQSPKSLVGEMQPTAYVCANFTCKAPTQDPDLMESQMRGTQTPSLTDVDVEMFREK